VWLRSLRGAFSAHGGRSGGYATRLRARHSWRLAGEARVTAGPARHGGTRRSAGTACGSSAADCACAKPGRSERNRNCFPKLIHTDRRRDKLWVDTVLPPASDTGVAACKRQQMAIMARPDSRPLVSTIKCPTLVLVGREDALTPPSLAQESADASPGAWLTIIPACGHLSTLEQPAAVHRALRTWLSA
jgi:pimeloyl-ACP methyl ester carboxylesterase